MNYQQPSIHISNIRIDEPVTVLTDLILGAICIYAFIRLKKQVPRLRAAIQFQAFFLFIGISTILGGIFGHGFLWFFNQTVAFPQWLNSTIAQIPFLIPFEPAYLFKLPGWLLGVLSIHMFQQGMVKWYAPRLNKKVAQYILRINQVEAVLTTLFVLLTFNFLYVVFHIIYGLLLVVCTLHIYIYSKEKMKGSLFMITAVATMILSGVIHAVKFGFGIWFTHHDVNHVLMALSIYLFLLGTESLIEQRLNERRMNKV